MAEHQGALFEARDRYLQLHNFAANNMPAGEVPLEEGEYAIAIVQPSASSIAPAAADLIWLKVNAAKRKNTPCASIPSPASFALVVPAFADIMLRYHAEASASMRKNIQDQVLFDN